MAEVILCKLCGQRRAKRSCPVVQGDICPICCGTEREVSIACPLDCSFLREAHKHEKPVPLADTDVPIRDLEIIEEFLSEHDQLLLFIMYFLLQAVLRTSGAVDSDVLEALAAIIKTSQTAESGLLYESRPENSIAAGIQRNFSELTAEFQESHKEENIFERIGDSTLQRAFIALRRIAQTNYNSRPRGRMFIDLMTQMLPGVGVDERAPSIIL